VSFLKNIKKELTNLVKKTKECKYATPIILFIFIFILQTPYFYILPGADESYYMYTAKNISDGNVLYRDIINDKTPGVPYLFSVVFLVFGYSLLTIRILTALINASTAILAYFIGKELYTKKAGFFSGILYGTVIINPSFNLYLGFTDQYMMFCFSLGIFFMLKLRGLKEKKLGFFIVGILSAFSFLMKQSGILLLVLVLMVVIGNNIIVKSDKKKGVALAVTVFGGFMVPILLTVLYFWFVGGLEDMERWAFKVWTRNAQDTQLLDFGNLIAIFQTGMIISFVFLPGMGFVLFTLIKIYKNIYEDNNNDSFIHRSIALTKKHIEELFIIGWVIITLLFILLLPTLYPSSAIICMFPICISSGFAFSKIYDIVLKTRYDHNNENFEFLKDFMLIIIIALALSDVHVAVKGVIGEDSIYTRRKCISEAGDYIKSNTNKSDTIYSFFYFPQIYVYTGRDSASKKYYTILPIGMSGNEMNDKDIQIIIKDLVTNKPKYVLTYENSTSWDSYMIGYDDVFGFIKSNYYIDKIFPLYYGIDTNIYIWKINNED